MLVYIILFLALALDFKGQEEGGSVIQVFTVVVPLFCASIIFAGSPVSLYSNENNRYRFFAVFLLGMIIVGWLVAVVRGVEMANHVRVVLPYVFLVVGFLIGPSVLRGIGWSKLLDLIFLSSTISMVFFAFYGYWITGLDINTVRYQILSPLLNFLIPLSLFFVYTRHRFNFFAALAYVAAATLVVISATRGVMLALLVSTLFSSILFGLRRRGIAGSVWKGLLQLFGVVSIVLLISSTIFPGAVEKFSDRFLGMESVGFDVTSETRLAEMDYQLDSWQTDLGTVLFGQGIGASYYYSGLALEALIRVEDPYEMVGERWFAGHNMYVYSLFSQGVLFFWPIPVLLFVCLTLTLIGVFKFRGSFLGNLSVMLFGVYIYYFTSSFGGNPLVSRNTSMIIGILMGSTLFGFSAPSSYLVSHRNEGGR